MAVAQTAEESKKVCFVTIGATASFNALLEAVLTRTFLEALEAFGYTDLLLQYGLEGAAILDKYREMNQAVSNTRHKIKIDGFDFNKQGLGQEMRAAKGETNHSEGVVISHAGIAIYIFCFMYSRLKFGKELVLFSMLFAFLYRLSSSQIPRSWITIKSSWQRSLPGNIM